MAWVTADQLTLMVLDVVGAAQAADTPVGADGSTWAWDSPLLPAATWTTQLPAAPAPVTVHGSSNVRATAVRARARGRAPCFTSCSPPSCASDRQNHETVDQAVQASVAGVVVEVAEPPVAVIPVKDGKEK